MNISYLSTSMKVGFNKHLLKFLTGVAFICTLSACNGIYDEPDTDTDTGFGEEGEIVIDASSYTKWVYIDFSNKSTVTLEYDETPPANWDIAVHRYDVKTNGAKVIETDCEDFNSAKTTDLDNTEGVSDIFTTSQIITDISTMMEGYLGYTDSFYNPELSKWLNVDTSTMPPVYSLSGKIYIVYLADGSSVGVKLTAYMNDLKVKGFLTIQYIYPFR